jgi:predicted ribosomally synthesized peptide with nif11-like leader
LGYDLGTFFCNAMSEEQISALLAKLKLDADLRQKLKSTGELSEAIKLIKEAGFDLTIADILRYDAGKTFSLSDSELEAVAGGFATDPRGGNSECVPICHDMFVSQYFACNSNKGNWGPGMCN